MVVGKEIKRVKQELQIVLDHENLKWKQRAKAEWLKNGDQNTKYYHACANFWRKSNVA
jgi:hypothetical protein